MSCAPVLAIDVGGTKVAVALVEGGQVREARGCPTPREAGADGWIEAIAALCAPFAGRYRFAGAALTGIVQAGRWSALNPATLPVPDGFPVADALAQRLGVPVLARNDAQAAAWGEHRFGAGQGVDLLFLTISSGIGGGLVIDGRLVDGRGGLAGHVGQMPVATPDGDRRLEDLASGLALARRAGLADARAVLEGAEAGAERLGVLVEEAVALLARALCGLQLVLDPPRIVIGGGLGLAPGYLSRLTRRLAAQPLHLRPDVRAAALGASAGLVGIADLVDNTFKSAAEETG